MNVKQNRTEPDDAINSALDDFWEDTDGSNDYHRVGRVVTTSE